MINFLRDRKVGKGKKNYLSELNKIAKEEREKFLRERIREIVVEEFENQGLNRRVDDISRKFVNVEKNFENLKDSMVPLSRSKSDTIRKIKMKRMIIELLKKHSRLTSSDLSVKLDLSRTRCSEYLTELERDGVAKGLVISRQKFYELTNQ